jgi:hypothetical protein
MCNNNSNLPQARKLNLREKENLYHAGQSTNTWWEESPPTSSALAVAALIATNDDTFFAGLLPVATFFIVGFFGRCLGKNVLTAGLTGGVDGAMACSWDDSTPRGRHACPCASISRHRVRRQAWNGPWARWLEIQQQQEGSIRPTRAAKRSSADSARPWLRKVGRGKAGVGGGGGDRLLRRYGGGKKL